MTCLFITREGGWDWFRPGAEDVRRFHNAESIIPRPSGDVLWGAPTLYRLPDGRWVLCERTRSLSEITHPREIAVCDVARWFAESGAGVIEWLIGPWGPGDPLPIRTCPEPPAVLLDDLARARESSSPAREPALEPTPADPPAPPNPEPNRPAPPPALAKEPEASADKPMSQDRRPSPSAENRALAVALRYVKEGKPLVITRIAEEAGCSASFLYRCSGFKTFLDAHEADKGNLPRGRKDRSTGDIEAYNED